MGNVNSTNFVVVLFDYTCESCRELHRFLMQVSEVTKDKLAIVNLPVPLAPECNRSIKLPMAEHTNACEYAKVALGIWRVAPNKFQEFDHWLFKPGPLPSIEEVKEFATQLVGADSLKLALEDGWVDGQVRRNVDVFVASVVQGNNSLPQVISGNKVASGIFRGTNDVYILIDQLLGLKFMPDAETPQK
jgi:hypothetical protein